MNDCYQYIFLNLDPRNLCASILVNKRFYLLLKSDIFWQRLLIRDYSNEYLSKYTYHKTQRAKKFYLQKVFNHDKMQIYTVYKFPSIVRRRCFLRYINK